MSEEPHTKAEIERDLLVRKVPCPTCAAPVDEKCQARNKNGHPANWGHTSHTSRYLVAAEAGLVPPLGGLR